LAKSFVAYQFLGGAVTDVVAVGGGAGDGAFAVASGTLYYSDAGAIMKGRPPAELRQFSPQHQ
jgi:hypothetical protein